jgi:plastocyanin
MKNVSRPSLFVVAALGLSFGVVGTASQREADAGPALRAQQQQPAITIRAASGSEGPLYVYEPAELAAKVGQPISITNNDSTIHSVTAKDRSFNVDVPGNSTVTFTLQQAGSFPYTCAYHPAEHNAASINVS